ncbi:hypothetical protein TNCV_2693251 [Trichonephila clavipes]|uniref:Uncharacterized protein n=1 Tax=Trichonephila clavipes TaxID=2585209 RepID=A0A8X6VZ57_TRICX|nr:hypothetical protein TNCV_2693251 [Trichonephila clavipes]
MLCRERFTSSARVRAGLPFCANGLTTCVFKRRNNAAVFSWTTAPCHRTVAEGSERIQRPARSRISIPSSSSIFSGTARQLPPATIREAEANVVMPVPFFRHLQTLTYIYPFRMLLNCQHHGDISIFTFQSKLFAYPLFSLVSVAHVKSYDNKYVLIEALAYKLY